MACLNQSRNLRDYNQLQPLFAGCLFSSSVPPAPEELPLQPLAEPPAPALSPLQALLPVAQPLRVKVDPAIRPAIQKPARIFFRSSTSMVVSLEVKGDISISPGAGTRQTDVGDEYGCWYRNILWNCKAIV